MEGPIESLSLASAKSLWVFLTLTIILGGAAAFVSGRAIALSWRSIWQIPFYMALLAAFVRFLHYALFGEPLLSLTLYAADFGALSTFAVLGFFVMRRQQMHRQYKWAAGDDERAIPRL
jgi:hypothetical protein